MKKLSGVVCVLMVCLALAGPAWGQAQITSGTIQGDVVDEKAGVVPGATVEIRNLDTNLARTQTTGEDGRFAFLLLPPGRYTVTISKAGFATIVQENVNLTVGQAFSLPVTMKVSAVEERIVVTATPVVDLIKTESSTTLNQVTVGTTPILGRKFEDLLTLTPGVSIVQGPDGDEINFHGQRGMFNNISLDGGDYNNGFFGEQVGGQRAAIDITLDAVKEFQVVAAGSSAEFQHKDDVQKWLDIIRKTWRKMSDRAQRFALSGEVKLPEPLLPLIESAVTGASQHQPERTEPR